MNKNPRTFWQQIVDRFICFCRWFQFAIQDRIYLWYARHTWHPKPNPLISIIIPTRNRWRTLFERALPSIYQQSYKNIEIIIVDDGSTENAVPFTLWDFNKDKRIKWFYLDKKFHYPKNAWCRWCVGPVRALNFAYTRVKGDYILRMDDDDELLPNALIDLLCTAIALDIEFLSAGHITGNRKVPPYTIRNRAIGGIQTTLMRSYLKYFKYNPDCWRKKRNSMNDIDIIDRMIKAGVESVYLRKIVCKILPRSNQTEIGWKAQKNEYDTPEKI